MKKIAFSLILFLITYSFIELFAYAAYRIKFGEYQIYDLQITKQKAIKSKDESAVFVPENAPNKYGVVRKPILHPYVGFSIDAKRITPDCEPKTPEDCLSRIKVDTDHPFIKRSEDTAIVAILGGSFADGTARGGHQKYFDRVMSNLPALKDKDVVIYNMAMGAFKQPQHLMQLAYYLSLGAEFDVIINLDGFNELAVNYYAWRDADLHPAFPKSWNHRVSSSLSKEHLRAYSNKFSLLESRANMAEVSSTFPLRWSPLVNFTWRLLDPGYASRVVAVDQTINKLGNVDSENRDFAYEALGPDYQIENWQELAHYTAKIWMDSSLAMRDLAEGNGARYYHFLQPNQYIEGSKPMTDYERSIAIVEKGGYGNVYRQMFPILQEYMQPLKDKGVHFYDLTYLFKDMRDILYVDNCCHVNPKGYDIVVRKLRSTIEADYYPLPSWAH